MAATDRFNPVAELSDNARTKFYIGGQWRAPTSRERLELVSPITEEITLRVSAGTPVDMDAAAAAARSCPFGGYKQSGIGREADPKASRPTWS